MNRLRILLVLGVLALIVALVPAAAAQDQTFGLSADDFALLTNANANSSAATAFDYAFTLKFDVSAEDAVNIALDGSGTISNGFSMNVTGNIATPDGDMPAQLGVVAAGDSLYISLDNGENWYGSTAEDLTTMFGSLAGGMLPFDPAALASGDLSDLEGQMGDMTGMMSGLEGLDPASFISMVSAPAADGTTQFTIDFDIVTLLTTPEFSQLMGMAMMGDMGMSSGSATPSPEELAMMGQMVGGMFADATLSLVQYVDPAAQLVTRTVLNLTLPLDAMSAPGDSLTLNFDISLSNYGSAAAVQAPASAQPLEQLMSGMMGGM